MGKEKPARWYDTVYMKSAYSKPVEECGYYVLYKQVVKLLPKDVDTQIFELGCGTGRLAKVICSKKYTNYLGVDFSGVAIKEARKYVPEYIFMVEDILSDRVDKAMKGPDVFIALEVLEHIKHDIMLISKIPPKKKVIFSVPSKDYISHVRHFPTFFDVEARYGKHLKFENAVVIEKKKVSKIKDQNQIVNKGLFLVEATKK